MKVKWMQTLNWPDYLFRLVVRWPVEVVQEVNFVIAVQRGAVWMYPPSVGETPEPAR